MTKKCAREWKWCLVLQSWNILIDESTWTLCKANTILFVIFFVKIKQTCNFMENRKNRSPISFFELNTWALELQIYVSIILIPSYISLKGFYFKCSVHNSNNSNKNADREIVDIFLQIQWHVYDRCSFKIVGGDRYSSWNF